MVGAKAVSTRTRIGFALSDLASFIPVRNAAASMPGRIAHRSAHRRRVRLDATLRTKAIGKTSSPRRRARAKARRSGSGDQNHRTNREADSTTASPPRRICPHRGPAARVLTYPRLHSIGIQRRTTAHPGLTDAIPLGALRRTTQWQRCRRWACMAIHNILKHLRTPLARVQACMLQAVSREVDRSVIRSRTRHHRR